MNSQKVHVISSTAPAAAIVGNEQHENSKIPFSSYWSWTFNYSTFPFLILGFPFYLLTLKSSVEITPPNVIYSTKSWLKSIFSLEFGIVPLIVSIFLLAPTLFVNGFVLYEVGNVFSNLFVRGHYNAELAWELIYLLRYIPVVVPLDFIWLRGYKVRKMIKEWDTLHSKYHGYGVASMNIRLKVSLIIAMIIAVNVIKGSIFISGLFELEDGNISTLEKVETVIEAVLDLCISLMIPLYCTFCYAVKFQLLIVKALIYQWVHQKAVPNIHHLDNVKKLYTEAADNILKINGMFSLYLSVALLMIIVDTISDSENLWDGLLKVFGGGGIMVLVRMLVKTADEATKGSDEENENALTPAEIRIINTELAGIAITYFLIFYMVRQAVATNDTVREINVWLNDFVAGGSGTNVVGVLKELGVDLETTDSSPNKNTVTVEDFVDECQVAPIWAKTTFFEDGTEDEFIKKFQMLKAYIHVRMQVEKPSLLVIALVGFLVPALSGRMKRYQVLF